MRTWRWLVGCAMAATLAGCAGAPAAAPVTPVTTIDVVEGDWHTENCIRTEDADARLLRLTVGYAGSRFLCVSGFGDRQYLLSRERGPMTLIPALFPGEGAILTTILRDTPAAAFGAGNVVRLPLDEAGISQLRQFLGDAVQTDASGKPIWPRRRPLRRRTVFRGHGDLRGLLHLQQRGPRTGCVRPVCPCAGRCCLPKGSCGKCARLRRRRRPAAP